MILQILYLLGTWNLAENQSAQKLENNQDREDWHCPQSLLALQTHTKSNPPGWLQLVSASIILSPELVAIFITTLILRQKVELLNYKISWTKRESIFEEEFNVEKSLDLRIEG